MTWSERRKLTYVAAICIVLGAFAYAIFQNITSVEPTCYDNKRNGNESGVDCGGVCTFYCKNELTEPKVRWVRTFQVTPGVVHAVAYIEHSYPAAGARDVQYQFKLYDAKNTLIVERTGTTYLGPIGQSAIVETSIPVGNNVPTVTRFSFLPPVPWEKIPAAFANVVVKTDRTFLEPFSGGTRLTATLENKSRYSFTDIDVVVVLSDASGNAITASKILLPKLDGQSSKNVYITWPFPLRTEVAHIEVIPRINPFAAIEI